MALYYKLANCNPVTPLLLFVVQLVSSTVDKILIDITRRMVCLWKQSFL